MMIHSVCVFPCRRSDARASRQALMRHKPVGEDVWHSPLPSITEDA